VEVIALNSLSPSAEWASWCATYHVEAGLSGAVAWRDGEVASARGEPVTNEDAVAALRGRNGLQDDRLELFLGRHVGDACLLR